MSNISQSLERESRVWLNLADDLRSLGLDQDVSIPQICVMGDQSSGKSSVLEALSGIPFPRGTGLVTRCPVQLMMKKSSPGTTWSAVATTTSHHANKIQVNTPNELTQVIENLTNELTGGGLNFATESITIRLTSPTSPDLTVIDLPGIIRTSTAGQRSNVIKQVNNMIESYLSQPRTIILAVIPSNQDIATIDILERALRVDPEGQRTLGVLTKPDLIDEGGEDEILSVLKNIRKPLRLGYVMVKNRTQRELMNKITPEQAKINEMNFFKNHHVYRHLDKSLYGIETLTKKLTKLLVHTIKSDLPIMKWELLKQQEDIEPELINLGDDIPESYEKKLALLLKINSDFCDILRQSTFGQYRNELLQNNSHLRLRQIIDEHYLHLRNTINNEKPNFNDSSFRLILENEFESMKGRELPGFMNTRIFFGFILQHIEKWIPSIETIKNDILNEIQNVTNDLIGALAYTYPEIVLSISNEISLILDNVNDDVSTKIDDMMKNENDPFLNSSDLTESINQARFKRFRYSMNNIMETIQPPSGKMLKSGDELGYIRENIIEKLGGWYMNTHSVNKNIIMINDTISILESYWLLSSKRVIDNICMAFDSIIINKLPDMVEENLLGYRKQNLDKKSINDLFKQDPDIVLRRTTLKEKKKRISNALNLISIIDPGCRAKPGNNNQINRYNNNNSNNKYNNNKKNDDDDDEEEKLSLPQKRASIANDGSYAIFSYTGDGDNGGIIYWLGTKAHTEKFKNPHDNNIVRITSSGMKDGEERLLVDRKRILCSTKNEEKNWICIDFGKNRYFSPTYYTLCNGSNIEGNDLTNWKFEGFDERSGRWIDLSWKGAGLASLMGNILPSPHRVGTWKVSHNGKRFRFLRWRSNGRNSNGSHSMYICAFELYGNFYLNS